MLRSGIMDYVAQMRLRVWALQVAVFAVALAGCSQGAPGRSLRLTAGPFTALYDSPIRVDVSGAAPGAGVKLRVSTVDAKGVPWSSEADFTASGTGQVSSEQPSTGGSYTGADTMGLFQTLAPHGSISTEGLFVPPHNWQMSIAVLSGSKIVARTALTRQLPLQLGVVQKDERPATTGTYGELFLPAQTVRRRPAVVVFGGSEGGLSTTVQAATLAAHGYPALALAYFHEPGLPADLARIPLEYFTSAVRLLAGQPGVDPKRIFVWGNSRGSEAAQLLGADFPALVYGVIATVPGADAGPAISTIVQPAWTLAHKPVPFVTNDLVGEANAATTPASNIAVERIRGPVLLVCGLQDVVWPSCPWTDAIVARLASHPGSAKPVVIKAARAGHLVGNLRAGVPDTNTSFTTSDGVANLAGGTPAGDNAGRTTGWTALLTMLHDTTN